MLHISTPYSCSYSSLCSKVIQSVHLPFTTLLHTEQVARRANVPSASLLLIVVYVSTYIRVHVYSILFFDVFMSVYFLETVRGIFGQNAFASVICGSYLL